MTETPEPIPPPLLPSRVDPERLRDLEAAALDAEAVRLAEAERATRTAMSPYDRQLREIHARQEEIATERRRRERAGRHAARIAVRERAGSGEMPTLADALLAEPSPLPEGRPLSEVRASRTAASSATPRPGGRREPSTPTAGSPAPPEVPECAASAST